MASWVLFISSLAALVLLIVHSFYRRGRRVTAAFFIGGAIFGVLRGNAVWASCQYCLGAGTGATPYLPQGRALPHLGHESLQVVIGWLFAGYLARTLSEFVLRRIKWEDRLFPTVALSALFMACMGYCMESAATRVGWWYWDFSTVNPYFGHVPLAGIAAWFSVAVDFIFPVLFIACSEYRAMRWRWLALLIFPLHMGAHALYNVVPWIDNMYVVLAIAVVALALFNRTRLEAGLMRRSEGARAGVVDFLPAIAVATFLAVSLQADLRVARDVELACTTIPLAVFALLAVTRIPIAFVAAVAGFGLVAGQWVGLRSVYSFAPLVAFAAFWSLDRAKRPRAVAAAWMAAALVLAGLFTAGEVNARGRMGEYVRLLKESRQGNAALREQALAMEFRDPDDLWWTIRHLLEVYSNDPESCLPEVMRRYDAITKADPCWTGPWLEWAGWLAADNQLSATVAKCRVAVGFEPTVGSHHAALGYFLLREGKLGEARKELAAAIDLGTDAPDARINLAVACAVQGDGAQAESLLREVFAVDPSNPLARLDLGHLKATPPRLRADLAHLAAPGIYDFLGFLMFRRADRKVHENDLRSAVRFAEEASHYVPRSSEYRTNYAVFLVKSGGSLEDAVDQCELAAGLDGRNESARRNLVALCLRLAQLQHQSGRDAAARATLKRAAQYAPREVRDAIENPAGGLGGGALP